MLKASPAKIKKMGIEHILPKKSAAGIMKELKKQMQGETALDRDLQAGWKGGPSFYANLSAFPITLAGKAYMVLVLRDITEKKILEEEMLKIDKLESVGELAGGIAHDFNNILTGILGNITMARIFVRPEDKAFKHLERAEKASWRGQNLTQQLLTFSRGGTPVKKVVSMGDLIMESARFASTGSSITCRFDILEDLWPVEADEGQMTQVINNLVMNADQAMPAGGEVFFHAENITLPGRGRLPLEAGSYVKIIIRDQGIGIPKKYHSRVFDPYFTTKQKGSGLGLTTAYSILKNHGGLITLASKQGKGSSFTIYLPASPAKMPHQREREAEAISGEGRILVLDDDPEVSEVVQSMLRNLGYEVELSSKSGDAIARYSEAKKSGRPFTAVILDLTMPGDRGGKEVIKDLRKIDPDIKAVVSSGYSDDAVLANFSKYGFRAALVKPFKTRHLGEALHKAIKGTGK
jgi:signal transduction histidine kinase/ActR/RegA family two-component response regulator